MKLYLPNLGYHHFRFSKQTHMEQKNFLVLEHKVYEKLDEKFWISTAEQEVYESVF
jgi:hypothetical protein